MTWYKKTFILLGGLVLCACTASLKQPSHKIDYYTLEYDPPKMSGVEYLPFVIKVGRFSVAPEYNTNQMIYRDKSFKRNAYTYHAWRAGAGDFVSYFLSRDMIQNNVFKGVLSPDSRFSSHYVLEGSVDEFFEWDSEEAWKAVLTVSVTLLAENEPDISKRVIFQKRYSAQETCKHKNPKSLAEAMSQAMANISRKIISDIHDNLDRLI